MSSGIKHCAFGRQCIIAQLHAGDRTRSDWTEIQEDDYTVNVSTFMEKLTSTAVARERVPEDLRLGAWGWQGRRLCRVRCA